MSGEAQTIPDDIMKTAGAVTKKMPQSFGWKKITHEVANAILAERERCALIAGYYAQACLETESDGSGYYACSALIDEIRSPKSPEPPEPSTDDNDLPF